MSSLAAPVYSPTVNRDAHPTGSRSTRYLYESPSPETNDQRTISLTFEPGFERDMRALLEIAAEAVNRLLRLPANWDGSGASAVSELAAVTAIEWLVRVSSTETAVPHFVPLSSGGLQFEWVFDGQSFELEVGRDGDVGVLGVDAAGNVIVEGEFPAPDGTIFLNDARKFLNAMFASPDRGSRR